MDFAAKMIHVEKKYYRAMINPRSGNIIRLENKLAGKKGNLTHLSEECGFGTLAYSRIDTPPVLKDTQSPIGVKSYVLKEFRAFALLDRQSGSEFRFVNPLTGHSLTYFFEEDHFDIAVSGTLIYADQIALDLNLAMMDLRQNDPAEEQFNLQSFYQNSDKTLCYCYFGRPIVDGILIRSLTPLAGWRLVYRPDQHAVCGFQMVGRFDSRFDHESVPGAPFDFAVRVSIEAGLEAAQKRIYTETGMPKVVMPVLSGEVGQELPFEIQSKFESISLQDPDGKTRPLEPAARKVLLEQEGFFRLLVKAADAPAAELILHAASSVPETLKRSCEHLTPVFGACAEYWYWVQAFCLNRQWNGISSEEDRWLRVALCTIGMQGIEPPATPQALMDNETAELLKSELPWGINFVKDGKYYPYAPIPEAHEFNGRLLSPFHMYKWERIQDGFEYVRTYLTAWKTFGEVAYYEHAIRIANAHIKDHLYPDGALRCIREWDHLPIDYTTVIAPLQVMVELYLEMLKQHDQRADGIKDICIKIADFLVKRGMDFPTEGTGVHLRWSEDGTIACTALSLLTVYLHVSADVRYLNLAREVLALHRNWQLSAPDARVQDSSFRYWETQWENDGEGRSINAGHAWTLWQAEALFLLGMIEHDCHALLQSWNGFRTNLVKFHPDGSCSSCFTPDYLPMRPRKLKLYHCYPEFSDRSLAFYVWPRLEASWNHTMVVMPPECGNLAADNMPIALNCRITRVDEKWHVEPLNRFEKRLYVKSRQLFEQIECNDENLEVTVWD